MINQLHHSITRCLAHDENGKPNGCVLADSCHRHLGIRATATGSTGTVLKRACIDDLLSHFIPVNPVDES